MKIGCLQDPRGRVWSTVYMTYASRVRRAHVTGLRSANVDRAIISDANERKLADYVT